MAKARKRLQVVLKEIRNGAEVGGIVGRQHFLTPWAEFHGKEITYPLRWFIDSLSAYFNKIFRTFANQSHIIYFNPSKFSYIRRQELQ
jgi:hypothetical protein